MSEWRDLHTMADVAAAQDAGEEIEVCRYSGVWVSWDKTSWSYDWDYRSRPRKQTKMIVLRRALIKIGGNYAIQHLENDKYTGFVMWLPGEEIVEVPV